ncbi:lipoate- ligase a [Trichoderma cornu-damae]|uniref:Putative lipoate-protein ligase A n=1 Tax=Trichoderma cornu-damae TaxID=654480 RepID=A0A9P8QS47_9HYPO|nr:lipoate- ligase a [Trichoderma cornu-damae]
MGVPQLLSRRAAARLPASSPPFASVASSHHHLPLTCRFSTDAASHPSSRVQIYTSNSTDPFLNLSVEHHLLRITPPDSTVLTLYVNSPSIIFGRNQNPWLQVNLNRLARIAQQPSGVGWTDSPVQLVRRRSGGGAVFHDGGNVNFSVICPPERFDRDRHAEMVVRALKALGRPNARVNHRHDIVVDAPSGARAASFKVSGSAYKLTRLRALHHGTCLLRSPNLAGIPGLLRSPAQGFLDARGVDSVRSPVSNVDVGNDEFKAAVVGEFESAYGRAHVRSEFDDTALEVDDVRRGYRELQSASWIWGQTPRFTFSTHPTEEDARPRPELPFDLNMRLLAKHGVIEEMSIKRRDGAAVDALDASVFQGASVWAIRDWAEPLARAGLGGSLSKEAGAWLNGVFGTDYTKMR